MESFRWTDREKDKEVLDRVKEESNIPRAVKRRMANWIGHILCRNCFVKRRTVLKGRKNACKNEEEALRRYRMTLKKGKDIGKRKH